MAHGQNKLTFSFSASSINPKRKPRRQPMPALFIFPPNQFISEKTSYNLQRYAPKFCPFSVLHFQEKMLKRRNRRETPRTTTPHKAAWLWETRYLENNCIKLFDCFDSYKGCQRFAARTSAAKHPIRVWRFNTGLRPSAPNRQFSPSPEWGRRFCCAKQIFFVVLN